ncbi:Serine protease 38 [Araneus ventricosus]|uniref:Serine protease 38 n=1 Tax=Araneus ventricosus TaxID=182803 RepID=A0A4Y2GYX5_ARAVE|nr:Serine protease 38 [Araneus ventricosus]
MAASVSNSEEGNLEADIFAVTDSDLRGDVGAFGDDGHEIAVEDLQSEDHVKRYANETIAIAGNGRITSTWYRSKRMRKPDDDEVMISEYYRRRRRPDYDDEDGNIPNHNERRRRLDDDQYRKLNDNRRRRNRKNFRGNCESCGKMIGGIRGKSVNIERVINGRVVKPVYKYPWIVSLSRSPYGIYCGGAIISATFILTAGHCLVNHQKQELPQCNRRRGVLPKICYFMPNEMTVGLLGRRQEDKQRPVQIAQLIPHDQFDYGKLLHDIALIKLAAPIQCNQLSLPICLPTTDLQKLDEKLITAGWGYNTGEGRSGPQLLREGTMKQVEPKVCQKANWSFYSNLTDIVCAVGTESKQSSCMGDSGTSIFETFGIAFYTIGVSSRHSTPDCKVDTPATYAKVFSYINWIKRHVKDLPES